MEIRTAQSGRTVPVLKSDYPKISIVTPSLNQAEFLESAIRSVLEQEYPNLEYIVIDGGSLDNSVEVIKKYQSKLKYWVSEQDSGHANALNKGFRKTTGEIMGWLNSDDKLHPDSLFLLAEIYKTHPHIVWTMGTPTHWDERGYCIKVEAHQRWGRGRLVAGQYQWIQQESTYWRRSLWEEAGGYIDENYKYACDLELWIRFSRHADLYPLPVLIGGFRCNDNQRTKLYMNDYLREAEAIVENERALYKPNMLILKLVKLLFRWKRRGKWIARITPDPEKMVGGKETIYYARKTKTFSDPNIAKHTNKKKSWIIKQISRPRQGKGIP